MSLKKEYYCKNHNCSDGFTDGKGNWQCWQCYKEDMYLNPDGEIIEEAQIGIFTVRALAKRQQVILELWKDSNGKKIKLQSKGYDYLSQASRVYMRTLHGLEKDPPSLGLE